MLVENALSHPYGLKFSEYFQIYENQRIEVLRKCLNRCCDVPSFVFMKPPKSERNFLKNVFWREVLVENALSHPYGLKFSEYFQIYENQIIVALRKCLNRCCDLSSFVFMKPPKSERNFLEEIALARNISNNISYEEIHGKRCWQKTRSLIHMV